MAQNRLVHLGSTFAACLAVGAVTGFVFVEITEEFHRSLFTLPQLREDWAAVIASLEPHLSRTLVGTVFFGLAAFFICRLALASFARGLLDELARMLRAKDLLPYSFHFKRETLGNLQDNLVSLFDVYVRQLHDATTERAKYQEALKKYADPTVAGMLKYKTTEGTGIKSGRRRVAVLFADIRGFTPMTESLMPEEVVMILNEHFSSSTQAITKNGGKVNKFIGDAIMAIFEEPPAYREGESASRSAVTAALEMCHKFGENSVVWASKVSKKVPFGLGVGVHVGEAILGNIGSAERMEYTAIGDTVNLSSRLCSLAKHGQVIVSQECYEAGRIYFEADPLEPVAIKGKSGLYQTYHVRRVRAL